jgi:hypothetical protein
MQRREPIPALPVLKLWWKRWSNEPDQPPNGSPMPTDLDTALFEIAEALDFDWPESLAVERVHAGVGEIVASAFAFAGFLILARRIIAILIQKRKK